VTRLSGSITAAAGMDYDARDRTDRPSARTKPAARRRERAVACRPSAARRKEFFTMSSLVVPLAVAIGLVAAVGAAAQTSIVQPERVITATRIETAPEYVGSTLTVIGREEIEDSGKTQAFDLLQSVPGLGFSRNGGPGGSSLVRIRGSEPGQVVVLIDGIRVNDPSNANNEFDFASLLTGDIERIEVLRGPQSALYGNDAMSGVINIITARGRGPAQFTGIAEAARYDTFRQTASVSGGSDRFDYAVSATNFSSGGFSRVRAGTERDGTESRLLTSRVGGALSETLRLDTALGYSTMDSDFDVSPTRDGPAFLQRQNLWGRIAGTHLSFDDRWENIFAFSGSSTERDFNEPLGFSRFSTFDGSRFGLDWQSNYRFSDARILTVGAGRGRENAATTSTSGSRIVQGVDRSLTTDSVFAQYQVSPVERLHATLGVRNDDNEQFGSAATYRVALAYEVAATRTTLRGSYGTASKAPTLFQLFDPSFGNPTLKVEKSRGADLGFEQRALGNRVSFGATLFHNEFDDLITFQSTTFRNVREATTRGVEATASWLPLPNWRLSSNYTFLESKNASTNRSLPRRPKHAVNFSSTWQAAEDLRFGVFLRHVTGQLDSATSSLTASGYTRLDVTASYRLSDTLTVYSRLENAFDVDYEEVARFRTPGRSLLVGLRATF
jgi:vitamin B12 transporter